MRSFTSCGCIQWVRTMTANHLNLQSALPIWASLSFIPVIGCSSSWIYLIFELVGGGLKIVPSLASAQTFRVCKVKDICESWTDPRWWVHNGPLLSAFFLALGLTYDQGNTAICVVHIEETIMWAVSRCFAAGENAPNKNLKCNWNCPPASASIWWHIRLKPQCLQFRFAWG